jgi:LPS sulfotransferase NodH
MVITLICEPRTGSNTLMKWFESQKNFEVLNLPFEKCIDYKNYSFKKENLVIKEEFHNLNPNFTELINFSDFVIFLYRENIKEQVESWVTAKKTKRWTEHWVFDKNKCEVSEKEMIEFEKLKNEFKQYFLNNVENFKISYESLYYDNGLDKIINHLKIFDLNKNDFPKTKKYRIDGSKRNLI